MKTAKMCGWIGRFRHDRRGNISVMVALLIVPLVAVMGIATETGNWFAIERSAQNAADSAVIAAATNASGTKAVAQQTYVTEGRSVATKFGFTNGANNTTVTVNYPDNSVPAKCSSKCYAVTITRSVPVYLNRVIGWGASQTLVAKAVAIGEIVPTSYCLVSLGSSGAGFQISGGNSVNLDGCNVLSNGDVTCNGSNSNGGANSITYGTGGSNKNGKCAPATQETAQFPDPYSAQASKLPTNTCSSYAPTTISGPISMNLALAGSTTTGKMYCGNVTLTGDVTITTDTPGGLFLIENGVLDLNGFTLKMAAGSGPLTIVFDGTSGGLAAPSNPGMTGTFQFSAPDRKTTGDWAGYAIYQDPNIPLMNTNSAGSNMKWNISGMIYLPKTNLWFAGDVNANALQCFVLIDNNFQSNGTGNILENQSQCVDQGVILPNAGNTVRTALVQ